MNQQPATRAASPPGERAFDEQSVPRYYPVHSLGWTEKETVAVRSIRWRNLFGILVGAAIMGFGINAFNLANDLAEGGVTGIAILLKLVLDWDPGITTLVANIPLFILGAKILGRGSMLYTVIGTVAVSFFLWLFGSYRFAVDDALLASLFAGVGVGVGLGIIFRYGGTTGGVDILARIAHKYWGWKMGKTMLFADLAVLGISLIHLSLQQVMYTAVAVFVGSRIIDFVQDAAYAARALLVVSDRGLEISKDIMEQMGRGATILRGVGAFTHQDKPVLFVVVGRSEVMRLKTLILERDPSAFISVSEASEVMGEGFTLDANRQPMTI
ncbi:MAG TPA: YitT family protein [Polyangiaceae bacterium]|nr:MAG: hypothetical protein BWY17_01255 [Deltaproteobacteria bacterium ADurb.Bin207]HNS97491.1 YitT family protein [Polyangiaceae bacterium]HNZ23003.1 YitT family protein [Polyangiaceae bacterium]HOD24377.1 YitT family protein [Polyangiaceae bacterium]HOE49016.1 YitT family protein [Polyangiaceae bacterium]